MPNASCFTWREVGAVAFADLNFGGDPKTTLASLQKIAVGFWMPKFRGNLELSPLVLKRLLAGFHVYTNQLFDKGKNITAAEFFFTISKGVKSTISQG